MCVYVCVCVCVCVCACVCVFVELQDNIRGQLTNAERQK